jgi:hypothetical protein
MLSFILKYAKVYRKGSVPEWLKGADCKSATFRYVGSNPTRPSGYFIKLSSLQEQNIKLKQMKLSK